MTAVAVALALVALMILPALLPLSDAEREARVRRNPDHEGDPTE